MLPSDALIGLFALLWPMIMFGRHRVWYDWAVKKSDFKYVNYATLAATVAVVPLGIALNFLKLNFDQFTEAGFPDAIGLALVPHELLGATADAGVVLAETKGLE